MAIFTIRTTSGREDIVVDLLETKIRSQQLTIAAVFHPAEIKGYVFLEGSSANVHKAVSGVMHVRGLIGKPVELSSIQHFLEAKKARLKVDVADIVEIIGGAFKGERGRVTRVDKVKNEVTIELLEASIPIPVTIPTEFVKVIKRANPESTGSEAAPEEEKEGKGLLEQAHEKMVAEGEGRKVQEDESEKEGAE